MTSAAAGAECNDTLAATDPTSGVRSILVPVDGSPASMDAVTLACSIAKKNKGKVYAVHVIEVKRSLPLDAELSEDAANGEDVLMRAERIASDADFKIEGELLQAREAGHAIVDEAMERGVDLILMGAEHKAPLGEYQMGRLTQYVLRAAPCNVWLWRHPVRE
jgi:nucleotide-binding universal stress UspA family protein